MKEIIKWAAVSAGKCALIGVAAWEIAIEVKSLIEKEDWVSNDSFFYICERGTR